MKILGSPQRLVAAAAVSRRVDSSPGVEIVPCAVVPLCQPHEIETYDLDDERTFSGWKAGVYDKAGKVCDASLLDRHWTRVAVPYWPREIDLNFAGRSRGDAMYGGLLFHHFGRFLLETTNRLWWCLAEQYKGPIIFQNTRPRRGVPDFAWRFFELLGIADRIVVADRPLGFERIIVPHRSYVGQLRFHDAFHMPFLAAGVAAEQLPLAASDTFGAGSAGLYLSRTHVTTRSSLGEFDVEDRFADAGFHIAHTQELSLDAQILLVRRHTNIVGIAGSAFHNILFCNHRLKPVYICKDYDINANFFMIDELMKNDSVYIYEGSASEAETPRASRHIMDDHWDDVTLDTAKVVRFLVDSGILPANRTSTG